MAQIDKHLKWCLSDEKRLKTVPVDTTLAADHLEKSRYNAEVLRILEEAQRFDWAINVGFYSIYHCFLAILASRGYQSRNQSCTITAMHKLIDDGKIDFDKTIFNEFDTLDVDAHVTLPTIHIIS